MKVIKIGPLEIDLDLPPGPEHNEKELLHRIIGMLQQSEEKQIERHKQIMTAIENLTGAVGALGTAVGDLTGAVDEAVNDIAALSPTDAQLNTLAGTVAGVSAALGAQAVRLRAAVNPPPADTGTPVTPAT